MGESGLRQQVGTMLAEIAWVVNSDKATYLGATPASGLIGSFMIYWVVTANGLMGGLLLAGIIYKFNSFMDWSARAKNLFYARIFKFWDIMRRDSSTDKDDGLLHSLLFQPAYYFRSQDQMIARKGT